MLDFIKELTNLQLAVIGAGLLVLFPTIKDLFLGLFTSDRNAVKTAEDVIYDTDLTAIVKKWEALADHCREAHLWDAYGKLEDLFPLLLKAKPPSVTKKKEETDEEQPSPT
tara:strand:- start:424 stop:756 length:333 start_codon:yes stop_codon:yes gene_type:complete